MCIPNDCDTCSNPKFKEISRQARCGGKTLGFFLVAHTVLAAARCVSFSFSAALTDLYVVLYGYYISRRYFRNPETEPQAGLCVQCESQQMVMCFMMLLSIDFGLSAWTLVELLMNQPVIPLPVGLQEFDYRTLNLWQWYTGVGVAIAVLICVVGEIISGWYLHSQLHESEIDYRYAKIYQNNMEAGFGGMYGGSSNGGNGGNGGNSGGSTYDRMPPRPTIATRNRDEPSASSYPETKSSTAIPSAISEEERLKQRQERAKASAAAAMRRKSSGMGTQ